MLTETFWHHFEGITDPRQEGKVAHPLISIFFIAVAAYIAKCEKWENVVLWANHNIDWLKKYVDLPFGIPSESTFYRVFRIVNPKEFERRFMAWTVDLSERHNSRTIALDGKTLRGAKEGEGERSPFHIVSAWASDSGLTLGFLNTDAKSNEITAMPELLKLLSIEGDIVTIDAMGTQTKIAEQIFEENKADYVLNLKGNQQSMYDDAVLFFTGVDNECSREKPSDVDAITDVSASVKSSAEQIAKYLSSNSPLAVVQTSFGEFSSLPVFLDYDYQFKKTSDIGHGRIEQRYYVLVGDVSWLSRHDEWAGLKSVGMVISSVTTKKTGDKSISCRFYLSTLDDIDKFASSVRSHWGCEAAHYTLDVTFSEDKCHVHTENGPENIAVIRRIARNLLTAEIEEFKKNNPKKRLSYDSLRFKTSLDINCLEKVMIGNAR